MCCLKATTSLTGLIWEPLSSNLSSAGQDLPLIVTTWYKVNGGSLNPFLPLTASPQLSAGSPPLSAHTRIRVGKSGCSTVATGMRNSHSQLQPPPVLLQLHGLSTSKYSASHLRFKLLQLIFCPVPPEQWCDTGKGQTRRILFAWGSSSKGTPHKSDKFRTAIICL